MRTVRTAVTMTIGPAAEIVSPCSVDNLLELVTGSNYLFRRETIDGELDQEVRTYVDLPADEKLNAGLSPEAARRAAWLQAGGINLNGYPNSSWALRARWATRTPFGQRTGHAPHSLQRTSRTLCGNCRKCSRPSR